jgi:hypothetical protein
MKNVSLRDFNKCYSLMKSFTHRQLKRIVDTNKEEYYNKKVTQQTNKLFNFQLRYATISNTNKTRENSSN